MKKATLTLDRSFAISPVDNRIFGSFIEPLGPAVYGDIYNPQHPAADEFGFRTDVIDQMRGLKTTAVRYPGGQLCFRLSLERRHRSERTAAHAGKPRVENS